MRFIPELYFFVVICTNAGAQERNLNVSDKMLRFEPEDVGAFHTDAFTKLAKTYGRRQPHEKTVQARHNDLDKIVASYCEEGNVSPVLCEAGLKWAKERIQRHVAASDTKSVARTGRFPLADALSPATHPDLRKSLEDVLAILDQLDDGRDVANLNDVTDAIGGVEAEIGAMDHVDPAQKRQILSAMSVAKESARLWHEVWQDEEHPLRASPEHRQQRHLQANLFLDLEETIEDWQNDLAVLADLVNVCNNGLAFAVAADMVGVLLTPVSAFVGIPTAYLSWILGVGVYLFVLINSGRSVPDFLFGLGFYAVLPIAIPFLMTGLPTTLLSLGAFSTLEDCIKMNMGGSNKEEGERF